MLIAAIVISSGACHTVRRTRVVSVEPSKRFGVTFRNSDQPSRAHSYMSAEHRSRAYGGLRTKKLERRPHPLLQRRNFQGFAIRSSRAHLDSPEAQVPQAGNEIPFQR